MFHASTSTSRPPRRDTSVPVSRTRIAFSVVQDRLCSVHAGAAFPLRRRQLCAVNVKLTKGLGVGASLLGSAHFNSHRLASGAGEVVTRAVSNSLVDARRRGDFLPCAARSARAREGLLRALPFSLPFGVWRRSCACAARPSRLIGHNRSRELLALGLEPLESLSESPQITPPDAPREPVMTLPAVLTAYVLLLAVVHLRVLLPQELENWTIDAFGFIPKRYDSTLLAITFPGGTGAKVWTFVTYSLLHANLSHLGFNVLWLLPFGSALARRFGAIRFFAFMAVTAVAGALAHLVTHEHAVAPMIGASASVSGP